MTYNVGAVIALTLYGKAFYAMSKFFDLLTYEAWVLIRNRQITES